MIKTIARSIDETEEWRDIPSFKGYYQASNLGNIRSVERVMTRRDGKRRTVKSCVLRPFAIDKYGHMSVTFKIQGVQKHRTVHSLVAEAFIGERREKQDVRHLDGNPRNNRVENLRYGTRSENMIDCSKQERQSKQKLNEAKVREIRKLLQSGIPYRRIAKMYGVHPSSIMNIKTRKSYAWIEE